MKILSSVAAIILVTLAGVAFGQEPQVVTVQQTDIKRVAGEVVQVRGNLLTLRHEDGSGRVSYRIPRGASIKMHGEPIRLQDLQPGQKIRVYYRETSRGRVIVLAPPAPYREPPVVVDDEPAEVTIIEQEVEEGEQLPAALPATASVVPLIGLGGLGFLGLGAVIAAIRSRLR